MKKRNVIAGLTATALAMSTMCTGAVFAGDNNTDYIKGDVTGDGYVGIEDAFYTTEAASLYLMPEDAVLPPAVKFNPDATDVDSDGKISMMDGIHLMKAIAGEEQWAKGYHKITSSDKSRVTYSYDGEFVIATVDMKTWSDTAIVYDKTKLEYVGRNANYIEDEGGDPLFTLTGVVYNNEELGFVDVASVCFDACDEPEDVKIGTFELKFAVKDDSKEVTLGSCTGAGYIQDNLSEGESFTDAAKKYEDALYTEETVKIEGVASGNAQQGVAGAKTMPATLTDAQQVLMQALKINNAKADSKLLTDMNKDGQVTLEDAQLALQLALKIISVDDLEK